MSGKEILVDTNTIIYLLQGDDTLQDMLQHRQLYVSFITELELFGYHKRTKQYEKQVETLLNDCTIVPMSSTVLQQYKTLRKSYKIKLADSIIAATALVLNIPIITADKQFRDIKSLKLIQYEK